MTGLSIQRNVQIQVQLTVTGKPASLTDVNHPDWIPCMKRGYGKDANWKILERYERSATRLKLVNSKVISKENEGRHPEMQDDVDETPPANNVENEGMPPQMEDDVVGPANNVEEDVCEQQLFESTSTQTENDYQLLFLSTSTQTENDYELLERELRISNLLIYELQNKLLRLTISVDSFKGQPGKVLFFTGLPNSDILLIVFDEISRFLNVTATTSLDKFQQFMLTLMKLRLNLSFSDLAYRFEISKQTASRVFNNTLHIMYMRFKQLVMWPEREQLQKTMPASFVTAFGKSVTIIIDCFEIQIEKPSNLMARCQTWSSYKHHHTTKYLIGISPQGVITFISDGWGGRCSDKHLTNECGILDKLLPGDVVFADRGFNINDEVGFRGASVNLPAFTKGKTQLHPKNVEKTRKIASVRIHVERVIGTVRSKYRITSTILPIEILVNRGNGSLSDQIVWVCCALCNICQSVVPLD